MPRGSITATLSNTATRKAQAMVSARERPALVVAIHGILTRTTAPSWPDHLDAFLRDVKVEKRDYVASPFAPWNVFVKNRRIAHGLADELALHYPSLTREPPALHFVAHSNGCDIAMKTIQILAARGIRTETVILTGSVTDPDIYGSGVAQLVDAQMLGRAYAYCGDRDLPLRLPLKWPYRSLGREGWKLNGEAYEDVRIRTRWFLGFGHGSYFESEHRTATFTQFRSDFGL